MSVTNDKPVIVYGDVCFRRKERFKRRKIILVELFLDFAKNTTLHGLRYITESGLSVLEKVFWLVTFILSIVWCFYLIGNVWVKWRACPVIVSFNSHVVPVGKVPFPSLTICPETKSMSSRYNYTNEYFKLEKDTDNNRYTDSQRRKFDDISLVCSQSAYLNYTRLFHRSRSNSLLVKHISEVSPTIDDIFFKCFWRDKECDCRNIFRKALTFDGVCYNVNALAANDIFNTNAIQKNYTYLDTRKQMQGWSLEKGYDPNYNSDPYPRRGRENAATPDMVIILKESFKERDKMCNSFGNGFKIYIQHPADFPQSSLYYYAALPGQVSSLALKFGMLTSTDKVRQYNSEIRQCYFPEEKPLRYFQIYTANNCRLECQSSYTFQVCGCVWYSMPHSDSNSICPINKKECVYQAQADLAAAEDRKSNASDHLRACKCLPSCDNVQYDAEILKTTFNLNEDNIFVLNNTENKTSLKGYNFSKIEVYFKEPRFVSIQRSELFGVTDFLGNVGGLLGLFLGFSFLSLIEIFYFITLRLYFIFKKDLENEKANTREEKKSSKNIKTKSHCCDCCCSKQ